MIDCTIQLLTPAVLREPECGRELLRAMLKHFPTHIPQFFGDTEPLRNRFRLDSVDTALGCWGGQFFILKQEKPKVLMQASFASSTSPRPRHSSITFFDFQLLDSSDLSTLAAFVKELAQTFHADYAMAHIFSQNELEDWLARRLETPTSWPAPPASQIVDRLRAKVSREGYAKVLWGVECLKLQTANLQRCLPNLYWLNVFGPPYVAMFGSKRLMEVPAESVETLAYGGTAIQLTNDLKDSKEGWGFFQAVRTKCRNHLDSNAFCDSALDRGHRYQTPIFSLRSGLQ
jgi:hypothetical protein